MMQTRERGTSRTKCWRSVVHQFRISLAHRINASGARDARTTKIKKRDARAIDAFDVALGPVVIYRIRKSAKA